MTNCIHVPSKMNSARMKDKNRLITNYFSGCGGSAGVVTSVWITSEQTRNVRFEPEPVDGELVDHTVPDSSDILQTIRD